MVERKKEENQGKVLLRYGKAVLLGGVTALIAGCVFLFLASLGISRGLLSENLQYQLSVVGCVLGSFMGGLIAIRTCSSKGILVGIAVGTAFFLIQLSVGVLWFESFSLESGGVGLLFGDLCGGAAAGILGNGEKTRAKKRKKKRSR